MAATSQIEIETTLPCLNHLPLPGLYSIFFYRPFLPEDLQAYNSFSNKPLMQSGQGNPHFEMSNTQDRFQRILESSFTQGIHLAFFFKRKDQNEYELIAEGGVYMAKSSWPSLYWTQLDLEINERRTWNRIIPRCIEQFWWSIPRKIATLRVDVDSLLKDTQGRQSSMELLCFHGVPYENLGYIFEEYKESHWRSWSNLVVKTTIPSIENISNLTTSSNRLILRQLTLEDAEALYSVQKQEKAMRSLGWINPDPDLATTRDDLARKLSPSPHHYFQISLGIFLKEDNKEQEMIGYIDVSLPVIEGWPYISYVLKEEYWGKKYGTEFLHTFITFWSSLPRKQTLLRINPRRLDLQPVDEATERIFARVRLNNLGSRGILRNNGFKEIPLRIDEGYSHWVFMLDF
jgi:RimJ/RimL family protein N-acetyltransferase